MKDLFSVQSANYAQFRPQYPAALYDFLLSLAPSGGYQHVWDCGTGTGQVVRGLAPHVGRITATDMSAAQLAQAPAFPNVQYVVASAERTQLGDRSVDIITVAQAIHWFKHEQFYDEVRRVATPDAIIAIWGYGLGNISPEIDEIVQYFYTKLIGKYWELERAHIDNAYTSVPFPFEAIAPPTMSMELRWNRAHFVQYWRTSSAVQAAIRTIGVDFTQELDHLLAPLWTADEWRVVRFPLFWRIGRVKA